MAEGHGGYRRPSNPAGASGPGKFSRRTDGAQPVRVAPGGDYGDRKEMQALQSAAPLQQSTPVADASPSRVDPSTLTPLDAESEQPGHPVTSGADAGPGDDMGVLGLPPEDGSAEDIRRRYGPFVPVLVRMADSPTASNKLREQVRFVLSQL